MQNGISLCTGLPNWYKNGIVHVVKQKAQPVPGVRQRRIMKAPENAPNMLVRCRDSGIKCRLHQGLQNIRVTLGPTHCTRSHFLSSLHSLMRSSTQPLLYSTHLPLGFLSSSFWGMVTLARPSFKYSGFRAAPYLTDFMRMHFFSSPPRQFHCTHLSCFRQYCSHVSNVLIGASAGGSQLSHSPLSQFSSVAGCPGCRRPHTSEYSIGR